MKKCFFLAFVALGAAAPECPDEPDTHVASETRLNPSKVELDFQNTGLGELHLFWVDAQANEVSSKICERERFRRQVVLILPFLAGGDGFCQV
jgi:hypothetical protein